MTRVIEDIKMEIFYIFHINLFKLINYEILSGK